MATTIEFTFQDDGTITAETGEKEEIEQQGKEKPVASIDEAIQLLKAAYQSVAGSGSGMEAPDDGGQESAMESAYSARNGQM